MLQIVKSLKFLIIFVLLVFINMYNCQDLLYSVALSSYIVSCLIVSAIRWLHVDPQKLDNGDYFVITRKYMSLLFLTPVVLIPAVWMHQQPYISFTVKAYLLLAYSAFFTILLIKYFGTIKKWKPLNAFIFTIMAVFLIAVIALKAIAYFTDWLGNEMIFRVVEIVALVLFVFFIIAGIFATLKVRAWIKAYHRRNYSTYDDFPLVFARKINYILLALSVVVSPTIFTDNKIVIAIAMFLLIVLNVTYLLFVLTSDRVRVFQQIDDEVDTPIVSASDDNDAENECSVDDGAVITISEEIANYVEKEKNYLNPHLTIGNVVDNCHYGRTYVSNVFKKKFGGFYNYINGLRLNYAEQYKKEHPFATMDEIAEKSGFASRQTFYTVKRRMAKFLFDN